MYFEWSMSCSCFSVSAFFFFWFGPLQGIANASQYDYLKETKAREESILF